MKKHYETHVEDTDKLISVAGPELDYKSWYEQYRKLMEEQAQRKYGLYTPTSEGDDDFPSIPGMIARYSAKDLTNEQMAANPVWVDKTGNGHDLQMKNFAWGGMSGVGGYNQNFNRWNYTNLHNATETHTSNKIELNVIDAGNRTGNIYSTLFPVGYIFDFNIKVTGLKDPCFILVSKGTTESIIKITNDGIYNIKATVDESWDQRRIYFIINNSGGSLFDGLVIEQLPLYPGALVFDGVDDYGICDNFPILTKEKGYTVVALRQWIDNQDNDAYLLSNAINGATLGAFVFERNKNSRTYNFGNATAVSVNRNPITYQTSNRYNSIKITAGTILEGNDVLLVGTNYKTGANLYANVAIWELVFLDHDATEEELTKIKDYFIKTYPWLFPDQAWTVTGKTNEDEDRATIANITGNGNDLVLSNFGFAEGSGYNEEGEYAGYLVTDGVDDKITSSAFEMGKDFTVVGEWRFIIDERKVAGLIKPPSFYLFNENNGLKLFINNTEKSSSLNTKSLKAICSDGRVYFDDWSEMLLSEEQPITSSSKNLSIGYNSTIYTQMAFKNLGIYNNQILSKDDCIKAYNYLQTLKAK